MPGDAFTGILTGLVGGMRGFSQGYEAQRQRHLQDAGQRLKMGIDLQDEPTTLQALRDLGMPDLEPAVTRHFAAARKKTGREELADTAGLYESAGKVGRYAPKAGFDLLKQIPGYKTQMTPATPGRAATPGRGATPGPWANATALPGGGIGRPAVPAQSAITAKPATEINPFEREAITVKGPDGQEYEVDAKTALGASLRRYLGELGARTRIAVTETTQAGATARNARSTATSAGNAATREAGASARLAARERGAARRAAAEAGPKPLTPKQIWAEVDAELKFEVPRRPPGAFVSTAETERYDQAVTAHQAKRQRLFEARTRAQGGGPGNRNAEIGAAVGAEIRATQRRRR